jgi:hypothetical protein
MATSTGSEDLRPHVREEEPRSDDIVVVRGGPDTLAKLAAHAQRTHRAFSLDGAPFWGVSVFCALDEIGPASLDTILVVKMANYRLVHTPTVGRIHDAGFELLPTFSRPHYTVRLVSDGDDELSRLLAALGPAEANPYHGRTPRPRRR